MVSSLRWPIAAECFAISQLVSQQQLSIAKIPAEVTSSLSELQASLSSDPVFDPAEPFIAFLSDLLSCGEANAATVSYILTAISKLHPLLPFPRQALLECRFIGAEKSDELILVKLLNTIRVIDGGFDRAVFDYACKMANGDVYGEALRLMAECFIVDLTRTVDGTEQVIECITGKLERGDCSTPLTATLLRCLAGFANASKPSKAVILKAGFRYMLAPTPSVTPTAINLLMALLTEEEETLSQFPQHFEWFVGLLVGLIAEGDSKSAVLREFAIACIAQLAILVPNLMAMLYVDFECSPGFPNTLGRLLTALLALFAFTKETKKREAVLGPKAAQALINLIGSIRAPTAAIDAVQQQALLQRAQKKSLVEEAARRFNEAPRDGLNFALENGLAVSDGAEDVAHFLRRTPGIDKRILGEYLVKTAAVLSAFMADFRFDPRTRIDEAVRVVLESFRLPGEGQQIDRVMETFASVYFSSVKDGEPACPFKSQDAAFVLAFSIIMLNTDQHNPQVRHRMTFDQFARNNRGINDGADFDPAYLRAIYEAIRANAIILPSEHTGEAVIDFKWNEISQRSLAPVDNVAAYGAVVLEAFQQQLSDGFMSLVNHQSQRHVADVQLALALRGVSALAAALHRCGCRDAWERLMADAFTASGYAVFYTSRAGNALPKYLSRVPSLQKTLLSLLTVIRDSQWTCAAFYDFLSTLVDCSLLSFEDVIPKEECIEGDLPSRSKLRTSLPADSEGFLSSLTSYWRSSTTPATAVVDPESTPAAREFVQGRLLPLIRDIIGSAVYTYTSDKTSFIRFALELQYWQAMKTEHLSDFPQILPQILSASKKEAGVAGNRSLTELALIALVKIAAKHGRLLPRALQTLTAQPSSILRAVIAPTSTILIDHLSHADSIPNDLWPALFAFLALLDGGKQDSMCFVSLLGSLLRPASVVVPEVFFAQYLDLWCKHLPHSPEMVTGAWGLLDTAIRRSVQEDAHDEYLIPLHWSIARCCADKDKANRNAAFASLQKLLTSGPSAEDYSETDLVLLPLIDELLEAKADFAPELLMRVVALLVRITLQNLSDKPASAWHPLNDRFRTTYWPTLAAALKRLSDSHELVKEAVEESVRNMLMVMRTQFADFADATDGDEWAAMRLQFAQLGILKEAPSRESLRRPSLASDNPIGEQVEQGRSLSERPRTVEGEQHAVDNSLSAAVDTHGTAITQTFYV